MTEEEVLNIIDVIVERLSHRFTFAYYEREDIKQEARILAIEGLDKYKPDLPLENFLWVHIRNRLVNFKRDNYIRHDEPCLTCPFKAFIKKTSKCKLFDDRNLCDLYSTWKTRNETKKNIISPISISVLVDDNENIPSDDVGINLDYKELMDKIDRNIPVYIRSIWLQLRAGVKIHAEDMRLLQEEVEKILYGKKDG